MEVCILFAKAFYFLIFIIMGNMNNVARTNRVLTKEEVNKILIDISKYFYLWSFNINLVSKLNQNGKIVINYKVSWLRNGEKISINDNFTL